MGSLRSHIEDIYATWTQIYALKLRLTEQMYTGRGTAPEDRVFCSFYRKNCLERPLSGDTSCIERSHCTQTVYSSIQFNRSPETLRDHSFKFHLEVVHVASGGLSRLHYLSLGPPWHLLHFLTDIIRDHLCSRSWYPHRSMRVCHTLIQPWPMPASRNRWHQQANYPHPPAVLAGCLTHHFSFPW